MYGQQTVNNNLQAVTENVGVTEIIAKPIKPKDGLIASNNITKDQAQQFLSSGISPDQANQLFVDDIRKNELQVKKILNSNKVKHIPQHVFDALVSMYNQLGNITYVYVKGEKIDLTGIYKDNDWQRLASFIAADERDKPRRIKEAAMILKKSYGPEFNEKAAINSGINKAVESFNKGRLNQQTGTPASDQQLIALSTQYLSQKGESMPGLNPSQRIAVAKNLEEKTVYKKNKKQAGPWPY